MPYSVRWYIENEIVYASYSGTVTAEDLRACMTEAIDMIESSPRPLVHTINDVGDVVVPLPVKDTMRVVREVGAHDRVGWNLTVREKSALARMGSFMGASIFKMRFRAFATVDEGMSYLKQMDKTLHWDKVKLSPSVSGTPSSAQSEHTR
ncbi:MAG TPA: hypothetical protein VHL11_17855 [Phototrophicaceae bacterium]|jgi:hypothetical protein|nr:hypothetical protein [Phototrophicaceae bacterium]